MATKSKRTVITDSLKIVVNKGAKNPFEEGTVKAKLASAVLASKGKTVADAKAKAKHNGATWAVRELVKRRIISVKDAA
jgi:hypothetical protein